nr:hypothetical protein [uncultured Rhodopila sp.]
MDYPIDLDREQIGRDAAAAVAGAKNVEACEGEDWTETSGRYPL